MNQSFHRECDSLPELCDLKHAKQNKINSLLTRAICQTHEQDRCMLLSKLMRCTQVGLYNMQYPLELIILCPFFHVWCFS